MAEHELEQLLGGFAADTLTPEEKQRLYQAALQDQQLFDALADEQALKELLTDPDVRRRLLHVLNKTSPATGGSTASWLDWFRRPSNLVLAGGLATAAFAVVLGTKVYQDSVQQAARSAATEATPSRSPAATEPSVHQPAESTAKARVNQGLSATAVKKDSPADTLRDDAPKNKQEENRKQAPIPPSAMGKASEEVAAITERPLAAGSPPAAAMPETKTAQTTAGASLPEAGLSTVSARGLFYGHETGRVAQAPERAMKPLAEAEPQASPFKQKLDELSQLSKAAGPVTPGKPLGLRYSFVIRTPDGQEQEVDAATATSSSTPVHITLETNRDGYIQVWQHAGETTAQLLLPLKETGHISMKIQAGQRQRLPLSANSGTVIVRLSPAPFGPISRQEAALLNRRSPDLIQESVMTPHPADSQERATYVVSQDSSPTAEIAVDIIGSRQ